MTWLITGGCGFCGSNLADAALARGDDVIILDDLSRLGSEANLSWLRERHGSDWLFTQSDVRDGEAVADLVATTRPHAITHLAGQVAMTTSIADPRLDFEINALGTLNVLEAVRLRSPESIVLYSSTNKVYGSLEELRCVEADTRYVLPDHPHGLDESLQLDGHSPYGCSKLAGDQYVRDYARTFGLRTVVFRHSSMYGGRQFATYDQGWIGWFCLKALEMAAPAADPFTISGDGKQVRDCLHADDLVEAYFKAAAGIDRASGRVYNIGGGPASALSLLELFALLEELTGNAMRFRHLDWRPGDQKVFVADCRRAQADFGFEPRVEPREGISRMLDWVREMPGDR